MGLQDVMADRARRDRQERRALREWLERMEHGVRQVVPGPPDRPVLLGRLGVRDHLVRKENPGLRVPRGPRGMRVRRPRPARRASQVRS